MHKCATRSGENVCILCTWCNKYPADVVHVKPEVGADCEYADQVSAECYKDFREEADELAYRVVVFNGHFYVVPAI